ncbi:MAG: glycosyltransferase family 9 protein [Elusimicrobiota bacterium]
MNKNSLKAGKKILIIQTAFLGDCLLTLPLINTLKKCFNAGVTVVTTPATEGVFESNPSVDDIILYDKKGNDGGIGSFLKLASRLRGEEFDKVFLPQRSFRSGLLAYLGRIPERIAFKRGGARFFATKKCEYDWDKHELERLLDLAGLAGCRELKREFDLIPDEDLVRKYREILKPGKNKKIIGISAQSEWPTKKWPKEKFQKLADEVKSDFKLVAFGKDREKWAEHVINLTGKTNIKELAAAVSWVDIMLSNDSGLIHVGAALGKPVVAIFGPTVPDMGFAPYGNIHKIIEVPLECRPCSLHGPRRCPRDHFKCMLDIGVDEVKKKLYKKKKELDRNEQ